MSPRSLESSSFSLVSLPVRQLETARFAQRTLHCIHSLLVTEGSGVSIAAHLGAAKPT